MTETPPLPPPSAGEGTLRSRGGEGSNGADSSAGLHEGHPTSGSRAPPLRDFVPTRPSLTRGPPFPAEGGGKAPDLWADAHRAALLLAADPPAFGGAILRAAPGPVRERWLDTLRAALKLLDDAGYELDGTTLRNKANKAPFGFEFLVTTRELERIALALARDVRRAGIAITVRVVDAVQYDQRKLAYDFDMIQNRWDQSLSPGNEQSFYWGSAAADNPGTRNYMGAREPAIDAMIGALLEARARPDFVAAVRALDRVLMSGFYAIPLYNADRQWIARWNRIQQPQTNALSGYLPETWWQQPTATGQ